MKKLRLLFVALFLLCITLTACQGNKPSTEELSPEGYWMLTAAEDYEIGRASCRERV